MRVLIIGGGGREHALAWKISQSPRLTELFVAPGNPGIATLGQPIPVRVEDTDGLIAFARREQIDLIVVGPEAPLAAGIADAGRHAGLLVFGPLAAAARIESSKAFAKLIMREAGVPTAEAHIFDSADDAVDFVRSSDRPWVVKADGLAAGKGVIVCESAAETIEAIGKIGSMAAGRRLLLEEPLQGVEASLLALCDGERLVPLLPAQDHKRVGDNDTGPNTGGMGAYAPTPAIPPADISALTTMLIEPVARALAARGTPYRGVLYAGLMLTPRGPRILEFNARFGDPETQAILPLLEDDLLPLLRDCAGGQLQQTQLRWRPGAAVCLVLAAAGYPDAPRRGDPIRGLESLPEDILAFHAGTALEAGRLITAGGRVLNLVASGPTLQAARARVYEAVQHVHFEGMHYRRDIAERGLRQKGGGA